MKIDKIFDKPKTICICGNTNEAKSNFIYYIIDRLKSFGKFRLYTYGLKAKIPGATKIFSIDELERIKDSIVILDEIMNLLDFDNKKSKKQIEKTLRLINHNNNILVMCALPENLKKFISGKIDEWFFKKCTLDDFINGSKAAKVCKNFCGVELGSSVLSIGKGEVLHYNGEHYIKYNVPYLRQYDSKKENKKIVQKNENKKVIRNGRRKK